MVPAARGRGPSPPPQQPVPMLDSDSEDDSDIVALDQAPEHLRPLRQSTPIMVLSDSESDDEDIVAVGHSSDAQGTSGRGAVPVPKGIKRTNSARSIPAEGQAEGKRIRFDDTPGAGPSQPAAGPSSAPDSPLVDEGAILPKADYLVPLVLEIIPDLCPVWAAQQLETLIGDLQHTTNVPGQVAVQRTIEMAFEMDRYPRPMDNKEPEEEGDYSEITYRSDRRRGLVYRTQSIELLQDIFATIPVPHIRLVFTTEGHKLLVPTYNILHKQSTSEDKPYQELKRKRPRKGKERAQVPEDDAAPDDESSSPSQSQSQSQADPDGTTEFRRENGFLQALMRAAAQKELEQIRQKQADEAEQKRREAAKGEAIARGDAIECGCCFDQEAPEESVACPEGHPFCKDCLKALVETKLGEQQVVIKCMDMSGCSAEYTEKVIAAAVPNKTMSLYHRLRQLKDLEMAAIEGLETCPFCPFAAVIENEHEKLFRCQNEECKKVTCRKCKRLDHIPKRCEEAEADAKLNSRHAIEEAMSEALVRKCPHCFKPYIKQDGCNKMICSSCGKMSCFVCRKPIKDYNHFGVGGPGPRRQAGQDDKCPLHSYNEARTEAERVLAARDEARRRALAEAASRGVEIDEADLAVEAPSIPAPRAPPQRAPLQGAQGRAAYRIGAGLDVPEIEHRLEMLNRAMAGGLGGRHPLAQHAEVLRAALEIQRRRNAVQQPPHGAPPADPGVDPRLLQLGMHRRAVPVPLAGPVGALAHLPFANVPGQAPVLGPGGMHPFPAPPQAGVRGEDFEARLNAWRQEVRPAFVERIMNLGPPPNWGGPEGPPPPPPPYV